MGRVRAPVKTLVGVESPILNMRSSRPEISAGVGVAEDRLAVRVFSES